MITHTAAMATREVVELARHPQQAGAQGLMIVPPFYEPLSEEEVRARSPVVLRISETTPMRFSVRWAMAWSKSRRFAPATPFDGSR